MPTIDSAAIANPAIVHGIRLPSPANRRISLMPVRCRIPPATRNSPLFITAWLSTCSSAPTSASGVASPMPSPM
jgi:hypothetical protein